MEICVPVSLHYCTVELLDRDHEIQPRPVVLQDVGPCSRKVLQRQTMARIGAGFTCGVGSGGPLLAIIDGMGVRFLWSIDPTDHW